MSNISEYKFNVEKKDTFIVIGGTNSSLELFLVQSDQSINTNDIDLENIEEFTEESFAGTEESEIELILQAEYALGVNGMEISDDLKTKLEEEKLKLGPPKYDIIKNPSNAQDFWTLVAICSREDGDPQSWCDVAQSIYNRLGSKVYNGRNISTIITTTWQYEPTWRYPSFRGVKGRVNYEWFNIVDLKSASIASGRSQSELLNVANALKNKTLQQRSKDFIEGRTDFLGVGQPAEAMTKNGSKRQRTQKNNQFGFSFNYKTNICYSPPKVIDTIVI